MLRKLVDIISKPLSIILDQSWQLGEVLKDWRKAKVTPVFKKDRKEDTRNYGLVSFTSIPRSSSSWKPFPGA